MIPTFRTVVVILLTSILVYVMLTRQISDPELLDWGFIGRNNLEEMSEFIGSFPTVILKKRGGFAIWDKADKNSPFGESSAIQRIEIRDNNWLANTKPWIYVYYTKDGKDNVSEYISIDQLVEFGKKYE